MDEKPLASTVDEYVVSEQRHRNMQRIKASGTGIERALQSELWHRGIRYRKNVKKVIGKPDICFIGKKVAVFCDSEFWHGYDWENTNKRIKSHRDFWIPKIERNIQRDKEVNSKLKAEGWTVLRFWGFEILKHTKECADRIEEVLLEREKALAKTDLGNKLPL